MVLTATQVDGMTAALRLALLALIAAAGAQPVQCAALLDAATTEGLTATRDTVARVGGTRPIDDRFEAARILSAICGACRLCPRGVAGVSADITLQPAGPE